MSRSLWNKMAFTGCLLLTITCAMAQTYPRKPVTIIVPSSAGGVLEMMARALSPRLSEALGQPFIIENRPGAHGILGADTVAKATPDGHVLLFSAETGIVNNPFLYANLPYDAAKAFAPIAMCCVMAQALVVSPALGVNSLQEMLRLAKSQPGKLSYGSNGPGSGSHLYMESLKRLAGVDVVHIPYKGSAPAVTDLVGGRVSMMVVTLAVIQSQLRSGKLKALAVGSAKRSSAFSDVPTAAEAGFPSWETDVWMGLFAPAGTPKEVVSRLNAEMTRITGSDQFSEQWLKRNGFDAPYTGSAEQFAEFVRDAMQKSERIIKASGVKLD